MARSDCVANIVRPAVESLSAELEFFLTFASSVRKQQAFQIVYQNLVLLVWAKRFCSISHRGMMVA